MSIIFGWFFGAFFVAFVFGMSRTIGFWKSFLISIIVSPLIGLFVTLFFKTNKEVERQKQLHESIDGKQEESSSDELAEIAEMRARKRISEQEFEKIRAKLLA